MKRLLAPWQPAPPPANVALELYNLIAPVNGQSQPNVTALRRIADAVDPLSLNIKAMGYDLARQLAEAMPQPARTEARHVGMKSSLSTQAAIESDWCAHWCRELQIARVFHRKIWEHCFVLQAVYEHGLLRPGVRALGFGCGAEPLPSYFAAHGIRVTATDLPTEEAAQAGWVETGQHATGVEQAFVPHLVSREAFDQNVEMRFVDMNHIPDDLRDYDFCWSICALEHLGSIDHGLAFIENALRALKPGGIAVHTTEYNIRDDGPTIDHWISVAFQKKHLEALAQRLAEAGHAVAPFDFALGSGPLDRFIDVPPFVQDLPSEINEWLGTPVHLKLAADTVIVTCVGLIVVKGKAA